MHSPRFRKRSPGEALAGASSEETPIKGVAVTTYHYSGAATSRTEPFVMLCAARDESRFADPAKNSAFYEATQTYELPVVFATNAGGTEDVAKLAPEAGHLLTTAFPNLTLAQANAILTVTQGRGGGFIDNGSAFGVYSRLNLYKAAEQAAALSERGNRSPRAR